jgi:3-oxosteroid 1-dehydrogenase
MAFNDKPARWDIEVDFVSIGSGIGGLAGAITAHDHRLSAIVLEKSGLVGGVTAYSFGELWVAANHLQAARGIEDSLESGLRYVEWLSMGFGDPQLMRNYLVHAPIVLKYFEENAGLRWAVIPDFSDYYWPQHEDSLREGRFLEVLPFPAASLGEWQALTRTTPHAPYGLTHDDIFGQGGAANIANWDFSIMGDRLEKDERCLGPGLAASFVKAALDRDIPLYIDTAVVGLITERGRVVGVRGNQAGRDVFIRASRGVLVAAGAYDGNPALDMLLDHRKGLVSAVPSSVTGDSIKMAGAVGAKIGQVPTPDFLGYHIPGEEQDGQPLWRASMLECGFPHTVVVNRAGRRFGDESFYRSIGHSTPTIRGGDQTQPNFPCWLILDSQYQQKYPLGSLLPGQEYPEGLATKADTIRELAQEIGADPAALVDEIEKFNGYATEGVDRDFQRGEKAWSQYLCGDRAHKPNPNLGTIAHGPFYAIPQQRLGTGMVSAGIVGDIHGRVVGYDDEPIEGLYVAGNAMVRLDNGAGYQSGMMNGRGMVFGYLAGRHAAGDPSRELGDSRLSAGAGL